MTPAILAICLMLGLPAAAIIGMGILFAGADALSKKLGK